MQALLAEAIVHLSRWLKPDASNSRDGITLVFSKYPISPISKPLPTGETNCIMQNYSKGHSKFLI